MSPRLVVIGGGAMGAALISGLLVGGWASPDDVVVVEASPARRDELSAPDGPAGRHPGLVVVGTGDLDGLRADGVVVAVKPGDVEAACHIARGLGARRLLSIAAGVTIAKLTAWTTGPDGARPAVVRAMPNTPALIGAAAAGMASAPGADEEALAWGESILSAVGVVVRVPESALDAVTGLSGSGPAYVFLLVEALVDAGVFCGLTRPVATRLAAHTVLGAGRMLVEGAETASELRAAVTSPAGTTAAGLRALEAGGLRASVVDAVVAATERSRQLGGA